MSQPGVPDPLLEAIQPILPQEHLDGAERTQWRLSCAPMPPCRFSCRHTQLGSAPCITVTENTRTLLISELRQCSVAGSEYRSSDGLAQLSLGRLNPRRGQHTAQGAMRNALK
eukprot:366412-Chlamydomonas_euryale.AAC.4